MSSKAVGGALSGAASGAAIGTVIGGPVGTAVGAVGGGLIGYFGTKAAEAEANGELDKAQQIREQVAAMYDGVVPPAFEQAYAQKLNSTAMEGVNPNAMDSKSIREMLGKLGRYGEGKDPMQDAAYYDAQVASGDAANRQAQNALSMANRRGIGGSGATLQAMLQGSQNAGDAMGRAGIASASDAYRQRLQALRESLAGTQGQQKFEYGAAADKAQAKDEISKFNANQGWMAQQENNRRKQAYFDNEQNLRAARGNARMGLAAQYQQNAGNAYQGADMLLGGLQTAANVGGQIAGQLSQNKPRADYAAASANAISASDDEKQRRLREAMMGGA